MSGGRQLHIFILKRSCLTWNKEGIYFSSPDRTKTRLWSTTACVWMWNLHFRDNKISKFSNEILNRNRDTCLNNFEEFFQFNHQLPVSFLKVVSEIFLDSVNWLSGYLEYIGKTFFSNCLGLYLVYWTPNVSVGLSSLCWKVSLFEGLYVDLPY
jgi:hypothetical protein